MTLSQSTLIDREWLSLPLAEWKDTKETLHLWTQIVGKIRLALAPNLNHWWQSTLYVTPRGLTTSVIPYGTRTFQISFDFLDSQLQIETSDGTIERIPLTSRPVADFYQDVMTALSEIGIEVQIWTMPQEIAEPLRFDRDYQHTTYDPEYAQRFWRILVQVDRVMTIFRSRFIGKSSPVQPQEAFYSSDMQEFILPYEAVRQADDPDAALLTFLQSTYEAAANLGHWDRAALERNHEKFSDRS